MSLKVKQAQMAIWVGKLEDNMENFLNSGEKSVEEKLQFIRNQYVMFDAAHKVLDGKAHFHGATGRLK